jgi:hypothetical protein
MRRSLVPLLLTAAAVGCPTPRGRGQPPLSDHAPPHAHTMPSGALPTLAGQDAFAAVSEIVALLERDPATDWSKVDLEALRQHLIDMNAAVLGAEVRQTNVPGGVTVDATGAGRVADALRRMLTMHAAELARLPWLRATTAERPGGMRLTVIARDPTDTATVARLRGLGFPGLLALGAHHQAHHLAIARGEGHH